MGINAIMCKDIYSLTTLIFSFLLYLPYIECFTTFSLIKKPLPTLLINQQNVNHKHNQNLNRILVNYDQNVQLSSSTSLLQSSTTTTTTTRTLEPKKTDQTSPQEQEGLTCIQTLAGNMINCLIKSDLKRKFGGDGGSTGWTSWVDDKSSYQLRCCIDASMLDIPSDAPIDFNKGESSDQLQYRDKVNKWIRWLKASPSPIIIEMSDELRQAANEFLFDDDLKNIESTRDELLNRMGLRLITLPSGQTLNHPIRTAAGAMAFGKLLWGGAKRYRLLPSSNRKFQRKTGERVAMQSSIRENVKSWMQFGGPERNYEAIDMGPCAILEVFILPKGLTLKSAHEEDEENDGGHMTLSQLGWDLKSILQFYDASKYDDGNNNNSSMEENDDELLNLGGKERNDLLQEYFTESVGGLQPQIEAIVRRVLDGRVFRSYSEADESGDTEEDIIGSQSLLDARELESLGLNPVRGLLLYGPPGCGKTAIAREISKVLHARKPKIVAAPELLDRWVGGSEKLVRSLFHEAELELKACNNDATKSSLHVIVIDEIDAVFRKRTSSTDSASTTRASAVNQILAKLDGVNTLSNVLLIGMTNRRELLDEALLRPGRLEVQIKIPLPNKEGRREIFQIHFDALRRRGRLSEPLCRAIDGPRSREVEAGSMIKNGEKDTEDDSSFSSQKKSLRSKLKTKLLNSINYQNHSMDLSDDKYTKNYSGADIQGLVRCSGSLALARARRQGMGLEGLLITLDDVIEAMDEINN